MRNERTLIEIARGQHGLITRSEVTAAGVSSAPWCRRTAEGAWLELAPGVWTHEATVITWELRVRAGLRWLGPAAALFGFTATRWWELDGADGEQLQFLVPRARRSLWPRMELHTTSMRFRADVVTHRGLRVTSVTRTITDLASVGAPARSIEAAIDSGIRRRLTSLPTLHARIAFGSEHHLHGVRMLRELLLDAGGESFLERRFLRLMRENRLPRPDCQIVHRSGSATVARVDFQFPGSRLIVEVSGRVGHASDDDRRKDARRRNELTSRGFHVQEFVTADVLDDPRYVVATVRSALDPGRGQPGSERTSLQT